MELIGQLTFLFLVALGSGTSFFVGLADSNLTGGGLKKVIHLISLACLVLGFLMFPQNLSSWPLTVFALPLLLLFFRAFYFNQKDAGNYLTVFSLGFYIMFWVSWWLFGLEMGLQQKFYWVVSTLFLGLLHYTMILGHWYLVTPKMSVNPLLTALKCSLTLWVIRLGLAVFSLGDLPFDRPFGGSFDSFDWMMVLVRFLVGHLGLLILGIFSFRLTKMRDTQGATGIFYVMVIFSFISELCGGYLFWIKQITL
jgi:hypothetical protein